MQYPRLPELAFYIHCQLVSVTNSKMPRISRLSACGSNGPIGSIRTWVDCKLKYGWNETSLQKSGRRQFETRKQTRPTFIPILLPVFPLSCVIHVFRSCREEAVQAVVWFLAPILRNRSYSAMFADDWQKRTFCLTRSLFYAVRPNRLTENWEKLHDSCRINLLNNHGKCR